MEAGKEVKGKFRFSFMGSLWFHCLTTRNSIQDERERKKKEGHSKQEESVQNHGNVLAVQHCWKCTLLSAVGVG